MSEAEIRSVAELDEEEEICSLMTEGLLVSSEEAVKSSEAPKPFAAFGSYRQRHGEVENIMNVRTGISSEAPAILGGSYHNAETVEDCGEEEVEDEDAEDLPKSCPVSIPKPKTRLRKILRPRNWSREAEREEAWERKRQMQVMEEEEIRVARTVGRSVSDIGSSVSSRGSFGKSRFRARSLTDDDLDELRGSIDLGFGFSNQADPELWNTLPALELCYAINQQYASPVSTLDDDGTTSEGSPSSATWTISSPGDHPQQVKTRLRHWAQAVACTIRQNYQQELY